MNNKENKQQQTTETSNDFYTLLGLVAIKDKQPKKTGRYEITLNGKDFFNVHFDTYFGWQFVINPELYYWRELN